MNKKRFMPIRLPNPEEPQKTESGATKGSTGEIVEALVNRLLIKRRNQRLLRQAKVEAGRSPSKRRADAEEKLIQDAIDNNPPD